MSAWELEIITSSAAAVIWWAGRREQDDDRETKLKIEFCFFVASLLKFHFFMEKFTK